MPRGGLRPGAGRPPGSKNKKSRGTSPACIAAMAKAFNMTPLEYMLAVMNDESQDIARRADMAVAAAPFIHERKFR